MPYRDGRLEDGCFAVTLERKYYHRGQAFIKRSLRPREFRPGHGGGPHVPRQAKERLMNEAAALRFVREHTDVPVPAVLCDFEDDGAYYLVTEHVAGESMAGLGDAAKALVRAELERHAASLRRLRSARLGGPSGIVAPPHRVARLTDRDAWELRDADRDDAYVFCHNDLSQNNVLVDPATLRITAILDWEYAGFYPPEFDRPFYHRVGPSVAILDEEDDGPQLLAFLESQAK